MIKILSSLVFLSGVFLAQAEEGGPKKGQGFEQAKAHAISMIDSRIKALQETRSCISSAQNQEALKKCREAAKMEHQEFKAERENYREERKGKREEWKAKREEWKGKRQEWKNKGGNAGQPPPPPPVEGGEE